MALGCLLLQEDAREGPPSWRLYALIGFVGAALVVSYPEFLAFTGLGVAMFLAVRIWHDPGRLRGLTSWAVTAVVGLAALWPLRQTLISFIAMQFRYASTGANTWDQAYFAWLYRWPPAGLWGFGPLVAEASPLPNAARWGVWAVGVVLTATLGSRPGAIARTQGPERRHAGLDADGRCVSAVGVPSSPRTAMGRGQERLVRFSVHDPCAGGNGLGGRCRRRRPAYVAWWSRAAAIAAGIFVSVQIALAVARPVLAARDRVARLHHGSWRVSPARVRHRGDRSRSRVAARVVRLDVRAQPVGRESSSPWPSSGTPTWWSSVRASTGRATSIRRNCTRLPDYLIVDRTPEQSGGRRSGRAGCA